MNWETNNRVFDITFSFVEANSSPIILSDTTNNTDSIKKWLSSKKDSEGPCLIYMHWKVSSYGEENTWKRSFMILLKINWDDSTRNRRKRKYLHIGSEEPSTITEEAVLQIQVNTKNGWLIITAVYAQSYQTDLIILIPFSSKSLLMAIPLITGS